MRFLNDPEQIPLNYGLRIAVGLIAYLLIMQLVGLSHQVELRLFNLLIIVVGVYAALRKFRATHAEHLHYFRGLLMGIGTAAIGSVVFAAFLFLYMQLNPAFLESI